ncbi:leucyl/phenylalanyl-tRNA-protein transferase [Legionella birminghamensis]|uniref:Leucyl/phenylalanyl-tRNA--protein transferase n=1 Tax=Legionella birminghamensis TaxID=28083 RepID=A0A378IBZ1_9GAMM|nr:leucyl/phenylalanyl-tRNA--protein transferase [Legionella birminghamensis]KTC73073.1 leucyl/phenylalanyl-tRNA-protein transferase [Legionella birminghamensis]STX32350.1 leucyl/phenylalanyl-tRNA-protein transferase [Legionella birminghamensis]
MHGSTRCRKISGRFGRIIISDFSDDGEHYPFPDPESSDAQGLLAIGGDLSSGRLLSAYRQGIFPWFEPGCPILWWSPNPRLILYPQQFKLSRSLTKSLKQAHELRIDSAFNAVIQACATVDHRENNTWISREMQTAYINLFDMGFAHSVEIWREQRLIGGLYGISLGKAFFGESMFHYERDASKMAMYYLCQMLSRQNFEFIDCQLPTAHLMSMGAVIISRKEFMHRLQQALQYPALQGNWAHLADCI